MEFSIDFFIVLILIMFFTFFFRIIYTLKYHSFFSSTADTISHLYLVKMLAKPNNRSWFINDERFLLGKKCLYPMLFNYLLARVLGYELTLKYNKLINPVIESIINTILFVFSYFVFLKVAGSQLAVTYAGLVSAFYIFSSIFFFIGGKISTFGARAFNYGLGLITIIISLLYIEYRSMFLFLLILFFYIINFLSSQFNIQMLFFFQLGLFVKKSEITVFLLLFLAYFLFFILNRKWIKDYSVHKVRHFVWFHKKLKTKEIDLSTTYKRGKKFIALWLMPYISAYILKNGINITDNYLINYLNLYAIISLIVFVFIWIPLFRPYGAAHRYLEFTTPFVYISLIYYCHFSGQWIFFFIILGINLIISINAMNKFNIKTDKNDEDLNEVVNFIKKNPEKTILPIPFKLGVYLGLDLENKIMCPIIQAPNKKVDSISKKYLFPINDLNRIKLKYPFEWIFYKKNIDNSYDFSEYKLIYQNSSFVLYEV